MERVKVIRDFGFVHFVSRERAEAAMEACRDLMLDGQTLKVSRSFHETYFIILSSKFIIIFSNPKVPYIIIIIMTDVRPIAFRTGFSKFAD